MKQKTIEIPQAVYTSQFLKFAAFYASRFKASNGFGKWLAEYEQMDNDGLFKPEKVQELYISILKGENKLPFIGSDAIYYIGIQAQDAANTYISTNTFDIRVITGEMMLDDDGEELAGLSMEEAINICNALNEEAEEVLFKVYNSNTNRQI